MAAKIGNRDSALHRMQRFLERVTTYLGRRPNAVVLFAEDYDALDDVVQQLERRERLRIERGPSVEEYVTRPGSTRKR